jgi:hypothetical protein
MFSIDNNEYNFLLTPDCFNNDIDSNDFLISNINNNIEIDDYCLNNNNIYENEMIKSPNQDNTLREDKSEFPKNNSNDNNYYYKEKFSSDETKKNDFLGTKHYLENNDKIIFKKNRNYLNNLIFKTSNNKSETSLIQNDTSSTSLINKIILSNKRTDTFLIRFKSFLGKSFINYINNRIKQISKRRIKFFLLNYKKFTLNVTYNQNKKWLNEKMKDLLILGGETNQKKNQKALNSLYRKKEVEFNEIKDLLELTYKEVIERFYLSKYFEDFSQKEENITLNEEFFKIMHYSLLEQNGFINFINSRKGNNKEK